MRHHPWQLHGRPGRDPHGEQRRVRHLYPVRALDVSAFSSPLCWRRVRGSPRRARPLDRRTPAFSRRLVQDMCQLGGSPFSWNEVVEPRIQTAHRSHERSVHRDRNRHDTGKDIHSPPWGKRARARHVAPPLAAGMLRGSSTLVLPATGFTSRTGELVALKWLNDGGGDSVHGGVVQPLMRRSGDR
jgi:hypothetical protein